MMVFFDDFSGGTCGKRRLYQENPQWPSYFRILVTSQFYFFIFSEGASLSSLLFLVGGLDFFFHILGIIIPTD